MTPAPGKIHVTTAAAPADSTGVNPSGISGVRASVLLYTGAWFMDWRRMAFTMRRKPRSQSGNKSMY